MHALALTLDARELALFVALPVGALLSVTALVFAISRAFAAWRGFRHRSAAFSTAMDTMSARLAETSDLAAEASDRADELTRSVEQLRTSIDQLTFVANLVPQERARLRRSVIDTALGFGRIAWAGVGPDDDDQSQHRP